MKKMSQQTKDEIVQRLRRRYPRSSRKAKGLILDEFCALTELNRKHAIKLLNRSPIKRKRPGRRRAYGPEVAKPLQEIWLVSDQMCSKLLKAALPEWLKYYQLYHGDLASEVQEKLLRISASQIDRLLASERIKTDGWRRKGPKPGTLIRQSIPVRTGPWEIEEPG